MLNNKAKCGIAPYGAYGLACHGPKFSSYRDVILVPKAAFSHWNQHLIEKNRVHPAQLLCAPKRVAPLRGV
jgi:hypothetical protein